MIYKNIIKTFLVFLTILIIPVSASAEGEVANLKQFDYWDNGKVRDCIMYDTAGHLKGKAFCRHDGTVEKVERYDNNANKTEEALYDEKGRLKIGIDGWAAMRWWYQDSVLRSQVSYDETGRPIERKFYGESGRLLFRQYREGLDDIVPYEAANMAMMLGGANVKYPDKDMRPRDPTPLANE